MRPKSRLTRNDRGGASAFELCIPEPSFVKKTLPAAAFPSLAANLAILLMAILLGCQSATAVEIGQTRDEIIARHGPPPLGNHQTHTAIYRWDLWKLEIQFHHGVAQKLSYTKADPITDGDREAIFTENGGKAAWKPLNPKLWMRSDGATAVFTGPGDRTLILQGTRRLGRPTPPPATAVRSPAIATASPLLPAPRIAINHPAHAVPRPAYPALRQPVRNSGTSRRTGPHGNGLTALGLLLAGSLIACAMLGKSRWFKRTLSHGDSPELPSGASADTGNPIAQPQAIAPPTIDSISPDQFELVTAEIYRRQGYLVEVSSGMGADGGVDVKLIRDGTTTLVQCKQWKAWKIKVPAIREFYGVLISEGAQRGVFISTANYTRDCREFAEGKPIDLLSRPDIDQLVKAVERPGENLWDIGQWIKEFTAHAHILKPDCPFCKKPMILRYTRNNSPFWGCSGYAQDKCRGKREVRPELIGTA